MLSEIKAGGFDFVTRAKTHDKLHDEGNDCGGHNREQERQQDRLDLVEDQPLLEAADNRVDLFISKEAGEERAEGATNAMDAEGVEGIVIADPRLQLCDRKVRNGAGEKADNHCAGRIHKPASGSDNDQARDDAGTETEHA